jgi:hypothetical protein
METEGSLQCSQNPKAKTFSEPDIYNAQPQHQIHEDNFQYNIPIYV